jgi:hypothetical protein
MFGNTPNNTLSPSPECFREIPNGRGAQEGEVMVEMPDRVDCLFTTAVDQRDDSYHIEIPQNEVE